MSIDQVNDSPYARLAGMGYPAVPCMPGEKRPGHWDGKIWSGMGDWTRFCERLPKPLELGIWSRWPTAGVCIALGFNGVVAVDIDTDQRGIVEAILGALPCESPVQKRGKKGATHFFRAGPTVVSQPFNVGSERVLDLLCKGKQTVVPPTIHPDTGKPYEWLTDDTLEHVLPEHLPMLPDDIAERIAAALKPFGYEAPVERAPVEHTASNDSEWREINDAALADLGAWVPHLGMDAKRQVNGTWRGKAIWKDAKNANVGFSPTGIKDWGGDEGLTAIDVTMKARSMEFRRRRRLAAREARPRGAGADSFRLPQAG